METDTDVPPRTSGFRRIVLCVDSSDASHCAARFARRFAQHGVELTIAAVALDPRPLAPHAALAGLDLGVARRELLDDAQRAIAESKSALANTAASVREHLIDLAKENGDVAHALADKAKAAHADLMILGTRQHHGLVRWLDPSVTDRLSQLAPCAMVVVPDKYESAREAGFQRILFAVDGSPTSYAAVNMGALLATPETEIRVVYVVDRAIRYSEFVPMTLLEDAFVKEGELAIAEAARRLESLRNVTRAHVSANLVSTDISADDVSHALLRDAERWNADLIVMGTHGRRGVARAFFGSVANRVASLARIPLMLVRDQHEEITPDGESKNAS
ncbi:MULTISPECIES: universal stress protein [unclassified Caballeronia]|uniref:universal stress protein n=1 Tax=unclassified Caballeronia TaxID=2646786 RepID=UPI001F459FE4|nr:MULTISPECIES: universal stress protein [unclassified Caballeronia]MCE4541790.1 universal stress protein [Caballeronia sp. PC1]MCE4569166.1 universal stress protein [Caballeronia sp. CLC5]